MSYVLVFLGKEAFRAWGLFGRQDLSQSQLEEGKGHGLTQDDPGPIPLVISSFMQQICIGFVCKAVKETVILSVGK